jgi:hypothetical protein
MAIDISAEKRSSRNFPAAMAPAMRPRSLGAHLAAQMLRVSSNAVKVRLHRARQALRGFLEQELTA